MAQQYISCLYDRDNFDSDDDDLRAMAFDNKCLVDEEQYSYEGTWGNEEDIFVAEVLYEEDRASQHTWGEYYMPDYDTEQGSSYTGALQIDVCVEDRFRPGVRHEDVYSTGCVERIANHLANHLADVCVEDGFRPGVRHEDVYSTGCVELISNHLTEYVTDVEAQSDMSSQDRQYKMSPRDKVSTTIKERVERLDHVTLNIGVTGNTGVGKSTFVNALRGLSNDDEGAAETGVVETTRTPAAYPHPTMPNVTIWDLPGIGTPNFKAKTYLSDVHFERYDFFIILTSERFKENDINLAKAIKKKKKLFYFIRSKVDNDINAESRRRDFSQERLLSKIREDCRRNLKCVGNPKVFLISSFYLQAYDFTGLIDTLRRDLPEKKKHALIQSLPVYSRDALVRKKKHFQKMIWLQAFCSCAGAILPIPGLTLAVDYGIVTSFFSKAFRSFGLDENSLHRMALRVNMDQENLKSALRSRFKDGVTDKVLMSFLNTPAMASLMTMKTVLAAFVVAGSLPAGALSVCMMRHVLRKGLREMAEDAEALLVAARLDQL
ncbi:hypothetical protein ACEWY4_019770 [Coilia grayii]|uniref:IRG-type G domain-containing protein n=1 Tax=Coilia grayii TaxID=363190 RepID=A0ABD1JAX0_9TELE